MLKIQMIFFQIFFIHNYIIHFCKFLILVYRKEKFFFYISMGSLGTDHKSNFSLAFISDSSLQLYNLANSGIFLNVPMTRIAGGE